MNIKHLQYYLQHFTESNVVVSNSNILFDTNTSIEQVNTWVVNYFLQYWDNNILRSPTIFSDIIVIPPSSLVTSIQNFLLPYWWDTKLKDWKLWVQYIDYLPVVYNPDNYLLINQSQNEVIRN